MALLMHCLPLECSVAATTIVCYHKRRSRFNWAFFLSFLLLLVFFYVSPAESHSLFSFIGPSFLLMMRAIMISSLQRFKVMFHISPSSVITHS